MHNAAIPNIHTTPAPVHGAICRDVALEMANWMLSHPGCSRDERREEFTDRQITRYALEAKGIADRRRVRRLA
jgi:hypothetical protein